MRGLGAMPSAKDNTGERESNMAVRCGHCKNMHASPYDVYLCSLGRYRQPYRQAAAAPPVETPPLATPIEMIKSMRDGRYAVRPDSSTPYTFVRVSRPKSGRMKGALKIQTQHSEAYKDCIVIWPSGRVSVYDRRVDSSLLLIVVDPVTATRAYGQELGRCCRCGRELTDERSRYYGIGPECEEHWPEIINTVDEERGAYYPGCSG